MLPMHSTHAGTISRYCTRVLAAAAVTDPGSTINAC